MKKLFNIFMLLVLIIPNFLVSLPTVVYSEEEEGFFGESIIQKFDVSSKNIQHTGVFDISLEFIGQSEDSSKPYYIYPGKEVFIPIETTTYTSIELANALPQLENAKLEYTSGGIKMTFLEGVKESYGIGGSFNIFLRGLNTQEDSTNTVKIGGETIFISNSRGGDRGVFAGKTGMFYGESNPDYVRWFLRGNINGDTFPGGPLKIQDKLGEGQILDGSGIEIGLFWGGQQHQTDYIIYNSVEEFLSSEFGSSAGSKIDYDKDNGSIDILIPESVLSEKEFSFTYDALITDYDIKEFKNKAEFNYFENQVPNNITNDASVMNTMSNGNMYGKKRANLNINKVVKGTEIPIPGVTFEISREDKGPLFSGKDNTTARYTTNEKGEIRESGFIPGELVVVEVDAPERVKFNSDDKVRLSLKANNKEETWTIENEIETVSIPVEKRWVGKAGETAEIHLKADGQTIASQTVTAKTNWEHIFKELPKYDATTGEAIDYTITETPVDGYNTTISGTASDGFVVTNTITGKVSVGVTKEWVGPKAKSVTIQLLANDKEVSEATLTAETNWQHTFDKLDQYDKDGKEITYRVTETSIKGYDSEISGNVAEGF
ncbi:Cna B-type domain-containing protein, partial [Vagococcus bubulae]